MHKIRSFDVFDTLLSRRYIDSRVIWEELGQRYGIDSFAANRITADTGSRSLIQIYEAMELAGQIPSHLTIDELYEAELECEKKYAFPIKENIDKVRNGDIFISR